LRIKYKENVKIDTPSLQSLYDNVLWTSYTKDMPRLVEAFKSSLKVITAWEDDTLVGLIRVVGDGQTIIYIQDILILESYQNQGIGSHLIEKVLTIYQDVRQKVLLTNDAVDVRTFYEKHGFQSCDKGDLVAFAKLG
jgi:ribosomal protein S18 acetylase RimI-like enzyme